MKRTLKDKSTVPGKYLFTLLLLFALASSSPAQRPKTVVTSPDLYWLSYIKNGCCVYLMQIDITGKVIKEPIQINGGPTISLNGTSKINLWEYHLRNVFDEQKLSTVKSVKSKLAQPDLVTSKKDHNFAIYGTGYSLTLKFIPVSPIGKRTGSAKKISSTHGGFWCDFFPCSGTVSADGKLILWSINNYYDFGLYLQLLDNAGNPNGSERFMNGNGFGGNPSNVLANGQFLVLYQISGNQLFVQPYDANTGSKTGEAILVAQKQLGLRPATIDPLGRFVLYTYKNKQKKHFIAFQALDGTGHPSGEPRVLVKNVDAYDFHLLKDE